MTSLTKPLPTEVDNVATLTKVWDLYRTGSVDAGKELDANKIPITPKVIRNLFQYCYQLYCNPNYTPGPSADGGISTRSGRRYNSVWPGLANFIATLQVNPLLYISYYFQYYPNFSAQPQQLKSEKWVKAFHEFSSAQKAEVMREWETGLESITALANLLQSKLGWESQRAWRYAVADFHTVQATKLVRLIVALTQNHEDVVEHTWKSGLARYTLNLPVYDSAWRPILPDVLRQGGHRKLRSVIEGDP
jgi:hypothetical protein